MSRFKIKPHGRTELPHSPRQYAQSDGARLNEMASKILAAARAGYGSVPLNRHERRVEARHGRKQR